MDDVRKVSQYEDEVDTLEEELREKHIERLDLPVNVTLRQGWYSWILSAIWNVFLITHTILPVT